MTEDSYFNGKRRVGGTAAIAHKIGQAGSVKEYKRKFAHDVLDRLLDAGAIEVVEPQLRVVNGGKE